MKPYLIFYLICGLLSAGITFAYFQDEYPSIAKRDYKKDCFFAYLIGLIGGPCGLLVGIFFTKFAKHGIRFF